MLAALLALSLIPLAGLLLRVQLKGGVISGSDSFVVIDTFQYLDWLRQAGEHVLIGSSHDMVDGARPFLHPGALISGGLHALGFGVALAHLVWKPVAAAALFAAALALARRFLDRREDRRLALVLALFASSPVAAFVGWGPFDPHTKLQFDFLSGETWAGSYLWGYPFTALAVACLPAALLAYERGRAGGPARMLAWASGAGLLCSWLQPWQGATLAIVLVAAEVLELRRGRPALAAARDLVAPLAATALPLAYYLVLSLADPAWELAGSVNDVERWPLWITVVGLLPLVLPALPGYRLAAPDFGSIALRVWPVAALVVFFQPAGTFPAHALQGMALPLSLLAVVGLRAWLRERPVRLWPAVVAVALLCAVGTAYRMDELRGAVNFGDQPFFFEPEERAALRWLEQSPQAGGVLTTYYLGAAVPGYTGRETWVGVKSWTPDFFERQRAAEDLIAGRLTPSEARRVVRASGARFLLVDCREHTRPHPSLRQVAGAPIQFGCASVYQLEP